MSSDYVHTKPLKPTFAGKLSLSLNDKPATLAGLRSGDVVSTIRNHQGEAIWLKVLRTDLFNQFFYNVTGGIPVYIVIARQMLAAFPMA